MGSLNGIYGIKSLFPAPTGSATEPTGILLMKLAMKNWSRILVPGPGRWSRVLLLPTMNATSAEDFLFRKRSKVIVYPGTFPNLHVYRLKERPHKTSFFIVFTNEDTKIDQNVDFYHIFSLNYGSVQPLKVDTPLKSIPCLFCSLSSRNITFLSCNIGNFFAVIISSLPN